MGPEVMISGISGHWLMSITGKRQKRQGTGQVGS